MQYENDVKIEHLYCYPQSFRNNFISNPHLQESLCDDTTIPARGDAFRKFTHFFQIEILAFNN